MKSYKVDKRFIERAMPRSQRRKEGHYAKSRRQPRQEPSMATALRTVINPSMAEANKERSLIQNLISMAISVEKKSSSVP